MKIDPLNIDKENFLVFPHEIAGENCLLIIPNHIGCRWTKENAIFRSSIWNQDGYPVSLGFKKFVNWGEKPEIFPVPEALDGCELIEKLDGSALIVSKYKGQLIVRTRGTSDARKLDNGKEVDLLIAKYPKAFDNYVLDDNFTLIYEWVSPINKIVLDYGPEPDIYLIGIIKHDDYSLVKQKVVDVVARSLGVKRPQRFEYNSIDQMIAAVEAFKGVEGVCIYSKDGQEIHKVKGAEYLAAHRLKGELGSFERVVDLWFALNRPDEKGFEAYLNEKFDFEVYSMCRGSVFLICEAWKDTQVILREMKAFADSLDGENRKEAASQIMSRYRDTNRTGFLFSFLDGKPLNDKQIRQLLYQVLDYKPKKVLTPA